MREQGTREPLAGVHVTLEAGPGGGAQPAGTDTDPEGRFSFAGLLPGRYTVRLRGPAVRAAQSAEALRPGRLAVVYYLAPRDTGFAVTVRAAPARREVVETVLTAQEVKRIPGNQNDPIKAVQNLPGVARAPFGAGQIVVWGSAPGDTRVYADGVVIPRVYHFGGLRSTLNAEFVTELSFRPGAYGADYGRGLGGVIDVTTRAPRSDRVHGSVTLDLIDGSVTLEGPITKKLHVAVGARLSWIFAFLPLFNTGAQLSPFYWDYQIALRYRATPRDDIDVLIFGATSDVTAKVDDADPSARVDIDSKSYFGRALLRYTHRFSKDSALYVMPSIGGDTFNVGSGDIGLSGTPVKLDVKQLGYNLRSEFRQRLTTFLDYRVGLDLEGTRATVETQSPRSTAIAEGDNVPAGGGSMVHDAARAESPFFNDGFFSDASGPVVRELLTYHLISAAPYLIARLRLLADRLELSPQLRVSIDHLRLPSRSGAGTRTDTDEEAPPADFARTMVFFEPRLFARAVLIPGTLALKAGLGIFHQPPQGAELSPQFGNPLLRFQFGATYVLGTDIDLRHGLHIEAQGFYKDLRSLVVPDAQTTFSSDGIGRVYGGELLVRQPLRWGLTGWIAYTLSRSERRDAPEDPWRVYRFDQTHILTVVASYRLPRGFDVGIRFRYVTGNPTTPIRGGVRSVQRQSYEAVPGEENSERLPDFHQLDVRADKSFTFNRWKLGLFVEIQNLYNRKNAESLIYGGRQLFQSGRVTGLPIFPNLGVRADF